MVLKYYGKSVSMEDIRKHAKTDLWIHGDKKIGGTQPIFMKVALNHYDVPCEIEYSNLDKLRFYIDNGRPPIMLVRSGSLLIHYVVVIGYTQKEIIIADPGDGARWVLENKKFQGCWNFTTDMEGVDPTIQCPICKGKGYIYVKILGKCDTCAGTGRLDPMYSVLRMFETHENIMIVPLFQPKQE